MSSRAPSSGHHKALNWDLESFLSFIAVTLFISLENQNKAFSYWKKNVEMHGKNPIFNYEVMSEDAFRGLRNTLSVDWSNLLRDISAKFKPDEATSMPTTSSTVDGIPSAATSKKLVKEFGITPEEVTTLYELMDMFARKESNSAQTTPDIEQ